MVKSENQNEMRSSDKRYFPRWEVNNNVSLQRESDENVYHGSTEDISCAGARITVDKDISPQEKLKLTIRLSESISIDLQGQVTWVKPDNNSKQIGVNFFDIPEKVQDLILKHAFEVDRKKIVENWFKGWK